MQMVKHTAQLSSKMFESVELARPGELKFLIKLDTNEEAEELIAYNQLMDYIQKKDPSQVHSGDDFSSSEQSLLTRDLHRKMNPTTRAANTMSLLNGKLG